MSGEIPMDDKMKAELGLDSDAAENKLDESSVETVVPRPSQQAIEDAAKFYLQQRDELPEYHDRDGRPITDDLKRTLRENKEYAFRRMVLPDLRRAAVGGPFLKMNTLKTETFLVGQTRISKRYSRFSVSR